MISRLELDNGDVLQVTSTSSSLQFVRTKQLRHNYERCIEDAASTQRARPLVLLLVGIRENLRILTLEA